VKKFDSVTGRILQIDKKFDSAIGRILQIDKKFDSAIGRILQIVKKFDSAVGRILQIVRKFDSAIGRKRPDDKNTFLPVGTRFYPVLRKSCPAKYNNDLSPFSVKRKAGIKIPCNNFETYPARRRLPKSTGRSG
jgi:hypothetical protein